MKDFGGIDSSDEIDTNLKLLNLSRFAFKSDNTENFLQLIECSDAMEDLSSSEICNIVCDKNNSLEDEEEEMILEIKLSA